MAKNVQTEMKNWEYHNRQTQFKGSVTRSQKQLCPTNFGDRGKRAH